MFHVKHSDFDFANAKQPQYNVSRETLYPQDIVLTVVKH